MRVSKWIPVLAVLTCLFMGSNLMAQEEKTAEKSNTKVIIIEEKVDKYGNKTVTKTVKEGNFTDEEIEKMIHEEGQHGKDYNMMFIDAEAEKSGYLGVQIQDTEEGVEITEVVTGSAAEDASLNAGDIITSVNGNAVESMEGLVEMISGLEPGTEVEISYTREGEAASTTATLGKRADITTWEGSDEFEWHERSDSKEMQEKMEKMQQEMHEKMQMREHMRQEKMEKHQQEMHERMEMKEKKMQEMQEKRQQMEKEIRKELEQKLQEEQMNTAPKPRFGVYIEDGEEGVVVTEVMEGSLAEGAGLQAGDIITEFNGVKVTTADALIDAVQAADKKVTVQYLRNGKAEKTKVTFEK